MKSTLAEIVENKRREVDERSAGKPLDTFISSVPKARGTFMRSLEERRVNLIAEIKPKSPSAGVLREDSNLNVTAIAESYNKYAGAISVLTDERYFGGSLSLLTSVVKLVTIPVLCKDFFIDRYQIYEARSAGAEAILLIVKILSDEQLQTLTKLSTELNMTAVIEIQNEDELERALAVSPELLLINNRNLNTFETDLGTTERLAPLIPDHIPFISASGIESASDILRLHPLTNRFLVGSSIMRSENIEAKLIELCEVPSACAL